MSACRRVIDIAFTKVGTDVTLGVVASLGEALGSEEGTIDDVKVGVVVGREVESTTKVGVDVTLVVGESVREALGVGNAVGENGSVRLAVGEAVVETSVGSKVGAVEAGRHGRNPQAKSQYPGKLHVEHKSVEHNPNAAKSAQAPNEPCLKSYASTQP